MTKWWTQFSKSGSHILCWFNITSQFKLSQLLQALLNSVLHFWGWNHLRMQCSRMDQTNASMSVYFLKRRLGLETTYHIQRAGDYVTTFIHNRNVLVGYIKACFEMGQHCCCFWQCNTSLSSSVFQDFSAITMLCADYQDGRSKTCKLVSILILAFGIDTL